MDIVKVKSAILIFVFISAGFVFGGKALACGGPPPEGCPSACDTWDPVKEKCIEGCKCACMGCEESTGYCYEDCDWEHGEHCCCPPDGGSGGGCCKEYECCIDGECVAPMCENCDWVSHRLYECGHGAGDTVCQSWYCIENIFASASCQYKGDDWPCRMSHCDTAVDPGRHALNQIVNLSECFSEPLVIYEEKWRVYTGCAGCSGEPYTGACETWNCQGVLIGFEYKYQRYKCGCQ